MNRLFSARRIALAATGIVAMAALSGCGALRPALSNPNYAASDGVRMSMGEVAAGENLMILSPAEDGPGLITGALTNPGQAPVTVTLTLTGQEAPFATQRLDAGQTLLLGDGEDRTAITIPQVPAPPGATQEVTFANPGFGSVDVPLPVLDGTFAEYASQVPTATPSPA